MAPVRIFWDPQGLELNALGDNQFVSLSDGDTPTVQMAIRMLSIDTPETKYPNGQSPARMDDELAQLAEWLQQGKTPASDELAAYLHPRLATGRAGQLQLKHGKQAAEHFAELIQQRLERPNGSRRKLFLHTADVPFDDNGRLLAYVAPDYTEQERERMSVRERATFNLLMVDSGWAASFPIYPSLPRYQDLVLLYEAARDAYEEPRGAWVDKHLMLTGYEYRMCVRLYQVTDKLVQNQRVTSAERYGWVERYCADMTTQQIWEPQQYIRVPPPNRLFIWPKDVQAAVGRMNLIPGEAGPA